MDLPKDIESAAKEAKASKDRIWTFLRLAAGARATAALALMFAITFGMTLFVSPPRLPPVGVLTPVELGLPIGDLSSERAVLQEATDAAVRQGAKERAQEALAADPGLATLINWIGLAVSLGVLGLAIFLQIRTYARGATPI